jgi:hypothetical protein
MYIELLLKQIVKKKKMRHMSQTYYNIMFDRLKLIGLDRYADGILCITIRYGLLNDHRMLIGRIYSYSIVEQKKKSNIKNC